MKMNKMLGTRSKRERNWKQINSLIKKSQSKAETNFLMILKLIVERLLLAKFE
jgi:hypothetical protein